MSNDQSELPQPSNPPARRRSPLSVLAWVGLFVVAGLLLIALLLPAVRTAREPARINSCMSNLRNIGLALLNYEALHGTLPPAYTVDEEGNRLHSWRTLILPYVEQQALYDRIDFSKPWDDPANAEARATVVEAYSCPSAILEPGMTTYLGVFGPDCVFSGPVPRELREVTDGLSNTLMVVDVPADQAVHWMSPYDPGPDALLAYIAKSEANHPDIIVAAFADGHADTLPLDIDPAKLRAMLTIAGGEPIEE